MRLAILTLAVLTSTSAAEPLELSLAKRSTAVLGDRFFLQLPVGMRVVGNPQDTSGLALPRWASTRAELEIDRPLADVATWPEWRAKLVMVAWDTYAHARDLLPDVRADLDRQGGVLSEAALRDLKLPAGPLPRPRVIGVDPPLPRRANQPNLIHAAYAADGDGGVVVIAFYAFGNVIDEIAEWALIARMCTATLELGNKDLTGHLGRSWLRLEGKSLEIPAPVGWRVAIAQSQDAGAAYIHATVALGNGPASCVVDQNIANAPANARTERARLLETAATWRTWNDAKRLHAEAIVAVRDRPRLRIACEASSAVELRELQSAVAKIRFEITSE
jgi:hypothetical protein